MGVYAGPNIVKTGFVVSLDAGNAKSYPTTGNTLNDLVSPLSFDIVNCTFNGSEIVGNGTDAFIQSTADLNASTYSDISFVLEFKSSDYNTESVVFDFGFSSFFYYFPTSSISNINESEISQLAVGISSFSPNYIDSINQTDTFAIEQSTATGISSFSPNYTTSSNQTDTVATDQSAATGISSFSPNYTATQIQSISESTLQEIASSSVTFNQFDNNSVIVSVGNNNVIVNNIVNNNISYISTSVSSEPYNLISLVYSNLNTQNATLSVYDYDALLDTVGIASFSFNDSSIFLLSSGGLNKFSNSSFKRLSLYNKSLTQEEIFGITVAYRSKT